MTYRPWTQDDIQDEPECESCGSIYHLAGDPSCIGTPDPIDEPDHPEPEEELNFDYEYNYYE